MIATRVFSPDFVEVNRNTNNDHLILFIFGREVNTRVRRKNEAQWIYCDWRPVQMPKSNICVQMAFKQMSEMCARTNSLTMAADLPTRSPHDSLDVFFSKVVDKCSFLAVPYDRLCVCFFLVQFWLPLLTVAFVHLTSNLDICIELKAKQSQI